jgi:two-component system phosphate regulon sensor histidine kinase PhoR
MDNRSNNANWQMPVGNRLITTKQALRVILYLLLSFPLGLLYFIYLVCGISIGIGTLIIWIGVPITLLTVIGWRYLAAFERGMAMSWLHVDIRPMSYPHQIPMTWLQRLRESLTDFMTWKSLAYLLIKFPLGILSFVLTVCIFALSVSASLMAFVLTLVVLPFLYAGLILTHSPNELATIEKLLRSSLKGFGLFTVSLYTVYGLAYVSGELARILLGMSDTAIRLAQAREFAEQERIKAERAEQGRRELIVNVSHELRTPIASIRGHVESLLMAVEDDEKEALSGTKLHDYLVIVQREAERLGSLVDDLLSLARTEAGELHLDLQAVDAAGVVEEIQQTMAPLARRERAITLVSKADQYAPPVLADRQRLAQVLLNLTRNAITYTPSGGIVSITLERSDTHYVALAVADTGIGIPPEDLDRVFERFYRTDASRARSSGGFGLGLAIVRDLVNAMGGSVSVTSKMGEGSCFRVLLRIATPVYRPASIPGRGKARPLPCKIHDGDAPWQNGGEIFDGDDFDCRGRGRYLQFDPRATGGRGSYGLSGL